jgi:hypothetical protein
VKSETSLPAAPPQSIIGNFEQSRHEPPRIQSDEGAYFILGMQNLSRRELLEKLARAGLLTGAGALAAPSLFASALQSAMAQQQESVALVRPRFRVSSDDDGLLDEISRCAVRFFWEQASPVTGLVKDRARADGSDTRDLASVAATGFGLSALAIADQRGYIDSDKILERVRISLRYIANRLPTVHGFYYHFVNMNNGVRALKCELSSIDSALLLCGVLTCRGHFDDDEIQSLSKRICDRVDWHWMLNGDFTLSHGWQPEGGFLKSRWDSYSELMMMYLLGLGSSTHPIPPESWDAWYRPKFEFEQLHYIGSFAPIFVHQYSHAWFDFHGKEDSYTDYFANSVIATEAHPLLPEPEGAISLFQRKPLGHLCIRFRQGLPRLGRPSANGPNRRHASSVRHRRLAPISARAHYARPLDHASALRRKRLAPLRLRRLFQSGNGLVRRRRDRHQRRHLAANGGKSKIRLHLEHFHEKRRSTKRHGPSRLRIVSPIPNQSTAAPTNLKERLTVPPASLSAPSSDGPDFTESQSPPNPAPANSIPICRHESPPSEAHPTPPPSSIPHTAPR